MATATLPNLKAEEQLAAAVGDYYADPLGFILFAFPWGVPGTPLEHETGPDENQTEFLRALGKEIEERGFDGYTPVMPIRMAESSGHGTGKSVLCAWVTCFIMSTRPHSIGTISAGTATQLEERTWAQVQYWMKLSLTGHWFDVMAGGVYHKQFAETWKVVAQTCREENSQSFAGQHAKTSTSWYWFDEASRVPDGIYKVAFGGLTDGEAMMFVCGQCEQNTGMFYEVCFGREASRWNRRTVDSRKSRFTNKALIEEWAADYGEDSDWFRVRVLGLAPRASELQFIDKERIEAAKIRNVQALDSDPLIVGVDVSGGGAAWNVIRFRRGVDGRSIPPIRIPGEHGRDREMLIARLADLLSNRKLPIAMMFIDAAFGSPIVERLHVLGYDQVIEVNFGGRSPDIHQANMRAYMHVQMKDWLLRGGIPRDDERLASDLAACGYTLNNSGKLVIESKAEVAKRLGRSPDDSDALALTFAQQVAPVQARRDPSPSPQRGGDSWMR